MTNETQQRIRALAERVAVRFAQSDDAALAVGSEVLGRLADDAGLELEDVVAGPSEMISFLGDDLAEFLCMPLTRRGWDDIGYDDPTASMCLWSAIRDMVAEEASRLMKPSQSE